MRTEKWIIKTKRLADVIFISYTKYDDVEWLFYCLDVDGKFPREEIYCWREELTDDEIKMKVLPFLFV